MGNDERNEGEMSTIEQLHRTVIVQPDFLDVGIAVETYVEEVTGQEKTYFLLFHHSVTWMGFAEDAHCVSQRSYLKGRIEGLEQVIRIEFPDREKAVAVSENWHQIGCIVAEQMKHAIKAATLVKFAGSM